MGTIRAHDAGRRKPARTEAVFAAGPPAGIIVVTDDAELERALRSAAPESPLMVATTPLALANLLMTVGAGALVLDIGALDTAATTVARHLAEQFPEVALVAVGSREDEARLAAMISSGLIYRFLHRPVSVARARTFVEAALRRSAESQPAARPLPARSAADPAVRRHRRPGLALAAAAAAATLAAGLWLALRPPPAAPEETPGAQRPADRPAAPERAPDGPSR
jgi:DNA-binding response OmpR family regulator